MFGKASRRRAVDDQRVSCLLHELTLSLKDIVDPADFVAGSQWHLADFVAKFGSAMS